MIIISLHVAASCAAYAYYIKRGIWTLFHVRPCSCVAYVSDIKRGYSVICDEIAYKWKKG